MQARLTAQMSQHRELRRDALQARLNEIGRAPARGTAHAAQVREKLSSEIETNLSLTDCVAMLYVIASVAFYPAMAWLLLS